MGIFLLSAALTAAPVPDRAASGRVSGSADTKGSITICRDFSGKITGTANDGSGTPLTPGNKAPPFSRLTVRFYFSCIA